MTAKKAKRAGKRGNGKTGRSAARKETKSRPLPIRDFSRSLPMLLLRARESVMQPFRACLRNHNLTEQQWRVLRALASIEEIEVTELAHKVFLRGPSLTRILQEFEARGLVLRRVSHDDRRCSLVSLGAKGLKVIEVVAPESEAIYAEITNRVGQRSLNEVEDILLRLEKRLTANA